MCSWHVVVALRTVGFAVDHQAARAADALAAVVLELDRVLALLDELLVEDVEHLEERHVGADVVEVVGLESGPGVGAGLPPDVELESHRRSFGVLGSLCSSGSASLTFFELELLACSTGLSSPLNSQAETWLKSSSSRSASPSSVWCSVRKWPPHDSSRVSASWHISSPNSKKSATRPAFSSVWLRLRRCPARGGPSRTPRGARGSSRAPSSGRLAARHAARRPR
jgi:hypothetical protein